MQWGIIYHASIARCIRSPASQGRIAGYRIGKAQSGGIRAVATTCQLLAKPVPVRLMMRILVSPLAWANGGRISPPRKKQALFQEECTPPLWNPPAQQTLEYQC